MGRNKREDFLPINRACYIAYVIRLQMAPAYFGFPPIHPHFFSPEIDDALENDWLNPPIFPEMTFKDPVSSTTMLTRSGTGDSLLKLTTPQTHSLDSTKRGSLRPDDISNHPEMHQSSPPEELGTCHPYTPLAKANGLLKCEDCDKIFSNPFCFKRHLEGKKKKGGSCRKTKYPHNTRVFKI